MNSQSYLERSTRAIQYRTPGHRAGPIVRMMSPGDLGEHLKPFVFLDLFELTAADHRGFMPHPHSGIATLTAFFKGSMTYGDTTGKRGSMSEGSVEWMRAGSGVWHAGEPSPGSDMKGFQLWVALPPELELGEAQSLYIDSDQVPEVGPARVLLGSYLGQTSPLPAPSDMTYLHVQLKGGERWIYDAPHTHDIAWLATNRGHLSVAGATLERELAVFEEGRQPIEVTAVDDAEFVIGSARRHPHPLIKGASSVHTSAESLRQGEQTINAIRQSGAYSSLIARKP